MKKLSLKVLSAGVAAFVALSSLPLASLTSSAYINNQASNAGTPYSWVMTSRSGDTSTFGTMGDREVYISADDIAAGDVSVPLNIYFDSTEWDELCGVASIRLSWATTKDATLADGGVVADDVYYVDLQSIDKTTTQGTQTYTATDGTEYTVSNTTSANLWCFTSLGTMMGMNTIKSQGGYNIDTNTWNSLSSTAGTYIITTEEVICDRIFGSDIYRSDKEGYVAFDISYLQSADEKGTGIKHNETIECEVLYKSDGTPYITYDYTRQDNYQTDTMMMDLPYYTTTRFVSRDDGKEYVPAANNMFSFITSACSLGSEYVGGDSMSFPVVGMTAVFPQGTPEGTYYVQVSTEDVYGNQYPVATESQFEEMRQKEAAGTSGYDLSTEIITYDYQVALAQDSTLDTDYVKVVIGEESTSTSQQTQQTQTDTEVETTEATTTKAPEGDEIYWNIDKVTVNAGEAATIGVTVQAADGVDASSWGVKGSLFFSKATAALFGSSNYYINQIFGNINEFDTASLDSAAASGTSADVRFGMAISSSSAADPTNGLFDIVIQTPDEDTVASVAQANGISIQYSSSIGYYYEFPIAWSDRSLSVTGNSGGTSVTMPSFEYRDSSGTYGDDIFDQVVLNDGYLRIAVSGEESGTQSDTTAQSGTTGGNTTSSSGSTDDYDIWIDISETRVSPETAAIVEVMVDSKSGVDASSYGVKGGMVINSATMDLMRGGQSYLTANNMSDPEYLFVPQFGSVSMFNETEIQAGLSGTSGDALVIYELASSVASDPSGSDLFQMYVCIPDEDTVVSIAQSNGLTLQYDSATGEYYYEFPITWSDRNATDTGYSGTTLVTMDRFQYMDASGNGGTNIMDRVGLYDGSIQVVVSGSSSSSSDQTGTTSGSSSGSTSTDASEDYDIWMVIENERVYPDNLAMVDITVEADDSVNARTYGFKGSFTFDDALVDVLRSYQSNNPGADVYLLQANYGSLNEFNTLTLDALLAGTSTDACSILMAQVTTVPTDPRNGSVATLNLCITDEQSVIDIANAYGMQLYYDATTDEYYYEFPITWDDRNLTDTGTSGSKTVTMTRFQYFNDVGTTGVNIIDEVGFIDGSVQIVISGDNATTADPPAVTTDSSGDTGDTGDTGSGDTGSGDTGSGDTGSDNTDSGDTESGDTGSGDTGSSDTGSGDTGSGDTGSGDTGSGDTGSGDTGSGDTGSGDTGSGDTGSSDTGSGDTGSGDTGSGDTGSGDTGSGDTGSGDTGSGDTGSGDTGSGDTGSGDTGSGDTGSGDTGSGDTGSGDTGSGDTGSGDTGSGNEGSGNEGSGNEGSGNEGSGNEGSGEAGSGESGETVADPSDITWSLDKMDVHIEGSSKTKTIEYNAYVANAIESSGFQGELYLPAETLALLTLSDVSMDDSVYGTFDAEYNQSKNYIAFAGTSSKVVKPSDTDGTLITFEFTIPSEEDVIAIALEYGMTLKSNANDASYYQFAVQWCDDEEEFSYLDAANRDAFSQFDAVELVDGYIRIFVDEDLVDEMDGGSAQEDTSDEDEESSGNGEEETSEVVSETTEAASETTESSVESTESSETETTELEIVFEPATFEADSDNDGTTEVYGVGFYFSADLAEFNPADLVSVATVNGEDVISEITFEYDTPKELFDAVSNGAAYIVYDMTAYYGEIELGTVTIYSAIKGDVNFSGAVDPNDGYDTLVYYSTYSLYGSASFTDKGGELELLAHFVADIDTELTDGTIDPNDSYYMLVYYAQNSLTGSAMWNSTVPSLKDRTY